LRAGAAQSVVRVIETSLQVADAFQRQAEATALRQILQPGPGPFQTGFQQIPQSRLGPAQLLGNLKTIWRHLHCRRARRLRANIGHHIGYGVVRFMPDPAHNGYARFEYGPSYTLLIKSPKVFETSAAASDDEHVNVIQAVQKTKRVGNLLRRAVTLNGHRVNPGFEPGPAPTQDFEHIAHRCPAWAGDQSDAAREDR
jgi:hypothetical protein